MGHNGSGLDLSPDESKDVIPLVNGSFHSANDLADCRTAKKPHGSLSEGPVLRWTDGRAITRIIIGAILT